MVLILLYTFIILLLDVQSYLTVPTYTAYPFRHFYYQLIRNGVPSYLCKLMPIRKSSPKTRVIQSDSISGKSNHADIEHLE